MTASSTSISAPGADKMALVVATLPATDMVCFGVAWGVSGR
jgi:hypothetical protein